MIATLEPPTAMDHGIRGITGMSELGRLVRQRRGELGITQPQLADAVGVEQSYISQIERGKVKRPQDALLARIAVALDLPRNDVFVAAGYVVRISDPEPAEGGLGAWIMKRGSVPADSTAWEQYEQRGLRVEIPEGWVDQARAPLFAVEVLDGGLPQHAPAISRGDVVVLESRDSRRRIPNGVAVLARVGGDRILAMHHRLGLRIQLRDGDGNVMHTLNDDDDYEILGTYFKRFSK